MAHCVVRIELDRASISLFGTSPVILVLCLDMAETCMRFREIRINLERLGDRVTCERENFTRRANSEDGERPVTVGQPCVCARVPPISRDCLFEAVDRLYQAHLATTTPGQAAVCVELVGLCVLRESFDLRMRP